ncbi:MAG: UvrD-helicase domain-containing protein, partial [Gammaproteobacteria bacterium]
RLLAVDPQRSVLVQAPAGSGKTTLLVERFLRLLATVNEPEEILAITFTRKAAAEMRARVLRFLDPDHAAENDQDARVLALGRALSARVQAWGLRTNPSRLLIRTIDSFNQSLARTMPVASALGPAPAATEHAAQLYRTAARRTLEQLDGNDRALASALRRLLAWQDNRLQSVEDLLTELLGTREQWLRVLQPVSQTRSTVTRALLEDDLALIVRHRLERLAAVVSDTLADAGVDPDVLVEALAAAARAHPGEPGDLRAFVTQPRFPSEDPSDRPLWRGLAQGLLTRQRDLRSSWTVRDGCPPGSSQKRVLTATREAIAALAEHAHDDLLTTFTHALRDLQDLPDSRYDDPTWDTLTALIDVLRAAAGHLNIVFAEAGRSDFAWLGDAAVRALGTDADSYTDLLLYLDRRIQHILVDEFQDTNSAQFELLRRLTSGWTPGDGRTLFVVGDPMQSIYRFREAEVGLFLESRDVGIGAVSLEAVTLQRNFRSRSEIVDWVNAHVGPIFPAQEDIAAGAVGYTASQATQGPGGQVDTLVTDTLEAEADAIGRLLADALAAHAKDPAFSAAIIVRARSHLGAILPALERHGVRYRAVKLDNLLDRPVTQDLLAITRCLLLPADRTALLALLRAPWCGLTLAELECIAGDGRDPLDAVAAIASLPDTARARAARVYAALRAARAAWRRRPLRELVEGVWLRLGGAAVALDPARAERDAAQFLALLERAEAEGALADWSALTERLAGVAAEGDPADANVRVDVLTMHGAKGLEWDLVILPGLHRSTQNNGKALLQWLRFHVDGQDRVVFAPVRATDQTREQDALGRFISSERRARERHEQQRLLYVAATRARERLVLSAVIAPTPDDDQNTPLKPRTGSLLADLWPTTEREMARARHMFATGGASANGEKPARGEAAATEDAAAGAPGSAAPGSAAPGSNFDQRLRRIAGDWHPSVPRSFEPITRPAEPIERMDATALQAIEVEFMWAGLDARRIGTVLHRLLEHTALIGSERITADQQARLIARIPTLLRAMGCRADALRRAGGIVADAYRRSLDSPTGRWLLRADHRDAYCELAVSGILDGQLVHGIIDRTFLEASGTRWIIDYKSGHHAGANLDGFLAEEAERYREQLIRYRRLLAGLSEAPIRTALYLPRHDRLVEID